MNKDIEAIINNACLPRFYKLMHIRENERSVEHPQVKPFYDKLITLAEESEQQKDPVQHFLEAKNRLMNDISLLVQKQVRTPLYIAKLVGIFFVGAVLSALFYQFTYPYLIPWHEFYCYSPKIHFINGLSGVLVILFIMSMAFSTIIAVQRNEYEKVDIGKIVAQIQEDIYDLNKEI